MKFKKHITEAMDMKEIHAEIYKFFRENPSPSDDEVHGLADKLGVNSHVFESHIYMILGSVLGAGRSVEDNFTEKDADPKQLKMGIEVEYEHTSSPEMSKRIALDHLAEIPDYYTRLDKMETDAGVDHHGDRGKKDYD